MQVVQNTPQPLKRMRTSMLCAYKFSTDHDMLVEHIVKRWHGLQSKQQKKEFGEITNMNICRKKYGPPITNKILTTNRINAAVKLQAGIQ